MRTTRRLPFVVAWTGAAAFAASLAWFVYCYLIAFGRLVPSGPVVAPLVANVLLFSAFALHHSVLARSPAKAAVRRLAPPELERSIYTWAASILFAGVCLWWQPVPGILYEVPAPMRAAGWIVQAIGLVLTVRASRLLDVLDLAGVRAVQRASQNVETVQKPALNTGGLYGFVRHPLYFSWVLFVFGTPVMTGTRAAFAVISTAYLMVAIPLEERGLVEMFGDEYERYRRRVRSRMIPWVY